MSGFPWPPGEVFGEGREAGGQTLHPGQCWGRNFLILPAELSECQGKLQELHRLLQSLESLHRIPSAPVIPTHQVRYRGGGRLPSRGLSPACHIHPITSLDRSLVPLMSLLFSGEPHICLVASSPVCILPQGRLSAPLARPLPPVPTHLPGCWSRSSGMSAVSAPSPTATCLSPSFDGCCPFSPP